MSYDVELLDPISKEVIVIEDAHFMRGGTYKMGGSKELELNITYNYGKILYDKLPGDDGLWGFQGKTALETMPGLEEAISNLSDDVSPNYWDATEGNVKRALTHLLTFAKMRPDGIWNIC